MLHPPHPIYIFKYGLPLPQAIFDQRLPMCQQVWLLYYGKLLVQV